MDKFGIEIINCENGFIIFEGNSAMSTNGYSVERRKWICATPADLGRIVEELALGNIVSHEGVAKTKESK